jgi:hypothetical protein
MFRIGLVTFAILLATTGVVGVAIARNDMDRQIEGVEYEFLQSAYQGIRFISPTTSADEGWTSYPPLATTEEKSNPSKLLSHKLGVDPLLLLLNLMMLTTIGLVLLTLPPAWAFWAWIFRPLNAVNPRISYTARTTVVLVSIASATLITCSFLDPGGLIAILISPVDRDWRKLSWEAGWTSLFIQNVRFVSHYVGLTLIGLIALFFGLVLASPLDSAAASKADAA